eukprot:Seg472.2 transcript_id=Seg472.2/GoldUCD/mRNA.D3Y31 product="hypothetical protein" protein_id=Seg472.2/GoldUCD/D3Y31
MESDYEEEVDTIVIIPPDPGEVTDEEVEIYGNQPALPLDVNGKLEMKADSKAQKQQEKHVATKRPSNKERSNKSDEKAAAEKEQIIIQKIKPEMSPKKGIIGQNESGVYRIHYSPKWKKPCNF